MCSGSVSLQDILYNSSHMLGPIEVTPDKDNSISFMISSSRENLNRFYDATVTLINSAGSALYNINISELIVLLHVIAINAHSIH